MNILVYDSSTEACSISLKANNKIYSYFKIAPRQHNKLMLSEIKKLINSAGITMSDLDYISYGKGPGSFVGVRLSAAITQGLAFPYKTPVIGFSSMHAVAINVYHKYKNKKITIIKDAKMGDLYIGTYLFDNTLDMIIPVIEYSVKKDQFKISIDPDSICIGDGCPQVMEKLPTNIICSDLVYPCTELIFPYLEYKISLGEYGSALSQQPIYLQGTSNWKKINER